MTGAGRQLCQMTPERGGFVKPADWKVARGFLGDEVKVHSRETFPVVLRQPCPKQSKLPWRLTPCAPV